MFLVSLFFIKHLHALSTCAQENILHYIRIYFYSRTYINIFSYFRSRSYFLFLIIFIIFISDLRVIFLISYLLLFSYYFRWGSYFCNIVQLLNYFSLPKRIENLQVLLSKQLKEWKRFTQTKRSHLPKQKSKDTPEKPIDLLVNSKTKEKEKSNLTEKSKIVKQSSTSTSGNGTGSVSATGSTECTTASASLSPKTDLTDAEGSSRAPPIEEGEENPHEAADDDPAEWADIRMQNLVSKQGNLKRSETVPGDFAQLPAEKKRRTFFFKKVYSFHILSLFTVMLFLSNNENSF